MPILGGDIGNSSGISGTHPFKNLESLTKDELVPGNPDIYYGARPVNLDQRVLEKLNGHIVPSTQSDLPVVPNFFVEVKGPEGSPAVAKRQVCYDGALGARGMQSLQSYGQKNPSHYNEAYTISATYYDGALRMYTHHISQPANSGSLPKYHMHQLHSYFMTDSIETFREGATFYRNGIAWAKEQRDDAIKQANERVRADNHHPRTLTPGSGFVQASSFTSERSSNATSTIEVPNEESPASLAKNSDTTAQLQTNETSSGELTENDRASLKRSIEHPKGSRRKRRNAGE